MSEIKLKIEGQYLQAFLDFLKTLNYASIQKVSGKKGVQNDAFVSESPVQNLDPGDPLWKVIRPLHRGVKTQDLLKEQGYRGTDWKRLEKLAKEMDIQEPLEDLLTQLTA